MEDIEMEDPDPIKASYDVFIKPHMSGTQQVYVLQFPNRDSRQPYSASFQSQPLKMRVKPTAGMVEVDVPMDVRHNYDKEKGVKWGGAMKKSKANHGLPGGFGIGGSVIAGRAGKPKTTQEEHANLQSILEDFDFAVRQEQVLVKQTLGGQTIPCEENTPQYMIGTFAKDQLHLTPVDNIVQMRPQFHHIDAQAEQDRMGRNPGAAARPQEARAVHMTVKSNIDGEEETSETMAQRIIAAQQEQWKSHRFMDEDDHTSWETYETALFVGVGSGAQNSEELIKKVPKLKSLLDDTEYLDFISAPRDAAKLSRNKKISESKKGKEAATETIESDTSSTLSDSSSDEAEALATA